MARKTLAVRAIAVGSIALAASAAHAEDGGWFSDFDISYGGFIRPELSIGAGGAENPNNERGNYFNGVAVARQPGNPPVLQAIPPIGGLPLPFVPPYSQNFVGADTVTRPIKPADNFFNLHIIRGELEGAIKFNQSLKLIARLRAIGDSGDYSSFRPGDYSNPEPPTSNGAIRPVGEPALYGGAPNYFQYQVEGNKHPNPLEWAGPNYLVYFPALFLDFQQGALDIRLGNQQIAWGQAIFFRVLDVVDGIDFRRHSILDDAQEEFSDKRAPSLGLRVNYQFTDEILTDAFVQKFQPTVFGNPNTQYNVIPAQFTVHDRYNTVDNKIDYGIRFKGNFGQWGAQAIFVRRYNPDGVFRWTQSGVDKNLPNNNIFGTAENLLNNGTTPNPFVAAGTPAQTTGQLLSQTPFEASPGGVYSAQEFCSYAAQVRLNCVTGLNAAIREYSPATTALLAAPVDNYADALRELDTFFIAGGDGLRGHIAREYFREYDIGGGASYVVDGAPGSLLDQLIINVETTYTPNRHFTNVNLSRDYLKEDSVVSALVFEKYQRFFNSIPATYNVLQFEHRTKDDLFGRSLKGYGGTDTHEAPGVTGGSNYIVYAFQQPFPQAIWRLDFAALWDTRGGLLIQPGVRWKPNGAITADIFYSYINGRVYGDNNPNSNAISTASFADEITFRLGYQF